MVNALNKAVERGAMKAYNSAHSTGNGLKWAFNMAYYPRFNKFHITPTD